MPTEQINLLVQLPFIAVFIWYVSARDARDAARYDTMQKQFQETLSKRDSVVDKLGEVIAANTQAMITMRESLSAQSNTLQRIETKVSETHGRS